MTSNRNTAKDALAWTILNGGYAVAKTAIVSGGVAAGLIDKALAKQINKMLSKISPTLKRNAWRH